jgi:hypothetical protein
MRLTVLTPLLLAGLLQVAPAFAKKPKEPKEPAGPTAAGWYRAPGWTADCYYPDDFASMSEGPRRMAWNLARDAIVGQWRGQRNDGIKFGDQAATDLETVMMAKADRVTVVVQENWEQCKAAMSGGGAAAWEAWVPAIAGRLTEGECPYPPLDYTAFNYLNINSSWQNPLYVCKGDKIIVHATDADYFQLTAGGPWINAGGDPNQKATGDLPCTTECLRGQLVMKYTSDNHDVLVSGIGLAAEFRAPNHGKIELMINDDSLSDNKYKVENRIEHHTGIEIKPAP